MSTDEAYKDLPLIKVVGISASGKSTLVRALRKLGYRARPVSQEHSNVPSLWQQFETPTILIYLDITLEAQQRRRADVSWDKRSLREETERLVDARGNADLKINTSEITAEEVQRIALTFLAQERIRHADHALPLLNATGSALAPVTTAAQEEESVQGKAVSKRKKRRANKGN